MYIGSTSTERPVTTSTDFTIHFRQVVEAIYLLLDVPNGLLSIHGDVDHICCLYTKTWSR